MASSPAPEALEMVRKFVNTWHKEEGWDLLDTPERAVVWLVGAGLLPDSARLTEVDRERTVALREAFRTLLLANSGETVRDRDTSSALRVVNGAASRAGISPVFGSGDVTFRPAAKGVDAALGQLLAIVIAAMADGTWSRLKVCASDECLWAFYDHARNRSGRWCEMAVCGNREKVRTYRKRTASTRP
jgi:predicted RNA-binding Zn ribbon-like protein